MILYQDDRVVVCVKPVGVVSTDEPGGLPDLLRSELGEPGAVLRTVHRLDQVVGGVIVLARTARAAADLSEQIRCGSFHKEYLALCRGTVPESGILEDLLIRDRKNRKTLVALEPGKETRLARLEYRRLAQNHGLSLVRIRLETGRTHQIRAQFSARGYPLLGDRKYGDVDPTLPETGGIGLWSWAVSFLHPRTNARLSFRLAPPPGPIWPADLEDILRVADSRH